MAPSVSAVPGSSVQLVPCQCSNRLPTMTWTSVEEAPAKFDAVSAAAREFAASLSNPYCGTHAMVDTAEWFGEEAARLRSFAYVALKGNEAFGLLAMASEDARRFYPEMGTLYLKRLGELGSAALARYLT